MHRRALVFTCLALSAGVAGADPAPIVYAGQGASPTVTQPASLAGGGENSYGYGAQARPRQGAAIDIRRPTAPTTTQQARQPLVIAQAGESASLSPSQPAAAPEQGARPEWLEQERVGPPYQANGRWYVPTPEPGYEQTGTASWYGPQFHGQRTANGEAFDQEGLTAAHPTLPLNSLVQVTNLANGREVIVRVNDRGPFIGERLIDLSHGAAVALDFVNAGHAQVHVRYLGPAPRRYGASAAPTAPSQPEEGPASLLPPAPASEEPALADPVGQPLPVRVSPASGAFFVQVGAYSDLTNAHNVRDAVAAAGPVSVDVRQTASGELFRVRVGPWASREDAVDALRTLASIGYAEAVLANR